MPSFDLVSKVDLQTLDNAINTVSKEITNRFDFKGSHVVIDLNKEISVRNGIKQEDAKKIVKIIKDSGLKVQVAIMDDIIRVTGKKIDDLQEVIQASKSWNVGIALQYINMKS